MDATKSRLPEKPSYRTLCGLVAVRRGMAGIAIRSVVRPPLIAVVAISLTAFAETPSGLTLSGVFDPDLAEIRPDAMGKLQEAAKKAHRDCYPPRVKFTVVTPNVGDPLFVTTLGDARQEALQHALPSLGLEPGQFKVDSVIGVVDGVLVTYDKFNDDDKDPPKLKVTWVPEKGTKVKAGDKIKVTIWASERYEDGHKSWPTGVQLIQLTADDGTVTPDEGKDKGYYGKMPPPCEPRTLKFTYTVPKKPPRIVHLTAIAEDGVGYKEPEVGEFPTVYDWQGTDEHFHDLTEPPSDIAASNHMTGRKFVKFDLYETSKGKLKGQAHATLTSSSVDISEWRCKGQQTIQDPETVAWDAQLTGTVQHLSDGSTQISFRATPYRGPSYNRRRIAVGEFCEAAVWHEEDAYWNGFNFTLKPGQDHYDQHRDLGLGADGSTGQHYEKIHVESSEK